MAVSALLGGCINAASIDVVTQEPATVEDREIIVDGEAAALPRESGLQTQTLEQNETMSPVANRLLSAAVASKAIGDLDKAADELERALRIEPQNAVLWSQLADVRYSQSDFQQAIQLAAKSNTLAANNQNVRRQNWVLMANAHSSLGDQVNAQRFRDKLQGPAN